MASKSPTRLLAIYRSESAPEGCPCLPDGHEVETEQLEPGGILHFLPDNLGGSMSISIVIIDSPGAMITNNIGLWSR